MMVSVGSTRPDRNTPSPLPPIRELLLLRGISLTNVIPDQRDAVEVPVIRRSPTAHGHGDVAEVDGIRKGCPGVIAGAYWSGCWSGWWWFGPVGFAGADGEDGGAVGFDEEEPAAGGTATPDFVGVFPSIVGSTEWHRVCLIGCPAAAGPFVAVVDVAQCCWNIAAAVGAGSDQQSRGFPGFASEQSLGAAEIDHDTVSINNNAADAPSDQRAESNIRMY
jgi:hypothetical protein